MGVSSQCHQPNLVSLVAACSQPPHVCIVTEFVGGGSVAQRLVRLSYSVSRVSLLFVIDEMIAVKVMSLFHTLSLLLSIVHFRSYLNYLFWRTQRRGRPSGAEVLRMARDAAAGIAHLHALRIVHRDLKPDNLLVPPRHTCCRCFDVKRGSCLRGCVVVERFVVVCCAVITGGVTSG